MKVYFLSSIAVIFCLVLGNTTIQLAAAIVFFAGLVPIWKVIEREALVQTRRFHWRAIDQYLSSDEATRELPDAVPVSDVPSSAAPHRSGQPPR